jgi:protein-L-isoaspartate(D-aspartate) O-methyltransferase
VVSEETMMAVRAEESARARQAERDRMVAGQIEARGLTDPLVLEAMRAVPREDFVPPAMAQFAYDDGPLPIGKGQTISQPYIVAVMTAAARLRAGERALEIGTGSGYGAAVLSRIASEVYTVERIAALAESARCRLVDLGYGNVYVLEGDGSLGWIQHAPYDAILVTASGPRVPKALLGQVAVAGRLVMPIGETAHEQRLVRVTRTATHEYEYEVLEEVAFVPLIGAEGWPEGS